MDGFPVVRVFFSGDIIFGGASVFFHSRKPVAKRQRIWHQFSLLVERRFLGYFSQVTISELLGPEGEVGKGQA